MIEPVEQTFTAPSGNPYSSSSVPLRLHMVRRSDGRVIATVCSAPRGAARGSTAGRVIARVELDAPPTANPFTPRRDSDHPTALGHVERLTERVAELERRLNGIIEQHHLWDGS